MALPVPEKRLFPIFEKNFRPKQADPLQEIQMTLQKSQEHQQQQAKRRKNLLGKKETPGLSQMILDAGQKEIGPVYCDECGLLYSPGDIEDEKEHQKAHSRLQNLFSIRLWKSPNIVQDFPIEGSMIVAVDCKTESKRVLNSLKDLMEWLDSELAAVNDGSESMASYESIFLYVFRTKRKNIVRVLGCLVAEKVFQEEIVTGQLNPAFCRNSEDQNNKLVLGITRLWTDEAFRRKHIASRLCDAVRINCGIPGFIVPKHQLGILEPSENGKAFMTRYTDNQGLLYTYKVIEDRIF